VRKVKTIRTGTIVALLGIAIGSFFFARGYRQLFAYPSPDLMRAMAGIGASIFLAYVVEATWMAGVIDHDEDYEFWLGFATGMAIAGLLGIGAALAVAEHRAAGHSNFLDDYGFSWSAFSLLLLGLVVARNPVIAYERMKASKKKNESKKKG
jgi:hypothetical protein